MVFQFHAAEKLELFLSYLQLFAILNSIPDIPFPDFFKDYVDVLRFLTLDLTYLREYISFIGDDVRTQFALVAVCIPLVLTSLSLMTLASKSLVAFYFFNLLGVLLLGVGLVLKFGASSVAQGQLSDDQTMYCIYSGAVIMAVSLVSALVYWYCVKRDVQAKDMDDIVAEESAKKSIADTIQRFLIFGASAFFGVFFTGVIDGDVIGGFVTTDTLGVFTVGVGIGLIVIALITAAWIFLGCSIAGRKIQFRVVTFLMANFVKLSLLLLLILYIPVATNVIIVFNCNEFSCPQGQRLPDEGSRVYFNATQPCQPCAKHPLQRCDVNNVCPAVTESRLEYSRAVQCDSLQTFIWPSSAVMIVAFVIGLPYIFFRLTRIAGAATTVYFPIDSEREQVLTEEEIWQQKVDESDTVVKFLYEPYNRKWRQWKLFFIMQKLAIVMTSVYVIRASAVGSTNAIAIAFSVAIHTLAMGSLLFSRPFIMRGENMLTIVMQLCLLAASVIGLLLLHGVEVDNIAIVILLILAAVLPIVVVVVGVIWGRAVSKQREAEIEALLAERRREKEAADGVKTMSALSLDGADKTPVGPALNPLAGRKRPSHDARKSPAPEFLSVNPSTRPKEESDGETAPLQQTRASTASLLVAPEPEFGPMMTSTNPSPHASFSVSVKPADGAAPNSSQQDNLGVPKRKTPSMKHLRSPSSLTLRATPIDPSLSPEERAAKLKKMQAGVDYSTNHQVVAVMKVFFIVVGVLGCVALGLAILGILDAEDSSNFLVATPSKSTVRTEFAGYPTFDEFTSHCCCVPYTNAEHQLWDTKGVVDVEKWICANGLVKERIRSRRELNATHVTPRAINGYAIRDFCGELMNAGCRTEARRVTFDASEVSDLVVELVGCPANMPVEQRELW